MKTFSCHGNKCREQLVNDYRLTPRANTKLLNGQTKISCTGQKLTDSYYTFEYQHKQNEEDAGAFFCGYKSAQHFLKLLEQEHLPIFNPLHAVNEGPKTATPKKEADQLEPAEATQEDKESKVVWNDTALQLYNAINLLIICWNKPIHGKLGEHKSALEKYRQYEPYLYRIAYVNNVVGKDAKKRSLTQMLKDLRIQNPTLKEYDFSLLTGALEKEGKVSHF